MTTCLSLSHLAFFEKELCCINAGILGINDVICESAIFSSIIPLIVDLLIAHSLFLFSGKLIQYLLLV